jgi:hypothetical protein
MAQGRQERLEGILDVPKQALNVGGEPIVRRTQRLLEDYVAPGEITVVGWPTFHNLDLIAPGVTLQTLNDPGTCIVLGLHRARAWRNWNHDRFVILLGDVVYSKNSLRAIFSERRELVFAGSSDLSRGAGEVYAVTLDAHSQPLLTSLIRDTACLRVCATRDRGQPGHLRNLLWAYQARHPFLELEKGTGYIIGTKRCWWETFYLPIDDWTNDIDTADDIETVLPALNRHVREEP